MVKAKIESIAFGGEGITKEEGIVTFIPFTAPEDIVDFTYCEKKKNFARGKLDEIIKPSPYRTKPFCSYFGVCGGCQLQHITYEKQLEIKRKFIEDMLSRIGRVNISVAPVVKSSVTTAYRQHITLKFQAGKIGYIQIDGKSFLPITRCPIFLDDHHSFFNRLESLLNKIDQEKKYNGSIRCIKMDERQFAVQFHFECFESSTKVDLAIEEFLKGQSEVALMGISSPHYKKMYGEASLEKSFLGLNIEYSLHSFLQNHLEQAENIYSYVETLFADMKGSVLDLYCGIGITSLLLARSGHTVLGIEYNPQALECAKKNADLNGLKNRTNFIASDVLEALKKGFKSSCFDYLLINPPRTGIDKESCAILLKMNFKKIAYISCMPSTLARDIKQFIDNGYEVKSVCGFDMFPQTTHVETVILLEAKKE